MRWTQRVAWMVMGLLGVLWVGEREGVAFEEVFEELFEGDDVWPVHAALGPTVTFSDAAMEAGVEGSLLLLPNYASGDRALLMPMWVNLGMRRGLNEVSTTVYGEWGIWFLLNLGIGYEQKFGENGGGRFSFVGSFPIPLYAKATSETNLFGMLLPYVRMPYNLRTNEWTTEYGLGLKFGF